MGKTLVIAEKPSAASAYAEVLNCPKKGMYYENQNYIITNAVGHLFQLKNPEDYDPNLKKWSMETLPIIPEQYMTKIIPNVASQYNLIKSLIYREDVEKLVNGGDCGIEGELIQRFILNNSGTKKPVYRLWIDDLTHKSIKIGFSNLKDAKDFDNYYYAALTRQRIDFCLGINYTRLYTCKLGNSGTGKSKVLSLGRCQTPILNLIVNRDIEFENFKSTQYYEVQADLGSYKGKFINLKNKDTKILDKKVAEQISNMIKNKNAKVMMVNKETKKKRPPKLFNLTDLQRTMAKKYKFTEDKTIKIAQQLYEERKILSYPRTNSNYLSDNIADQFEYMLNYVNFGDFSKVVNDISKESIDRAKSDKGYVDNSKIEDHYALVPTEQISEKIYSSLTSDEKLVFDEVMLRFLSIFYDDYKYESTQIITVIDSFAFITKGVVEVNKGWKSVYSDGDDEKENEEASNIDEQVNKGDVFKVNGSQILIGKTKGPKRYTSDTVLGAMQKYNIGTEATRAEIIQTLIKRNYVIRDGIKLISTDLGKDLIKAIEIDEIKSVQFTSKLEDNLKLILNNKIDYRQVYNEAIEQIKLNIEKVKKSDLKAINIKENSYGVCPLCKGNVVLRKYTKGEFYGCDNYKENKCDFRIPGKILGTEITPTNVIKILTKGESNLIKFSHEKGEFKTKLVLDRKTGTVQFAKNSGGHKKSRVKRNES